MTYVLDPSVALKVVLPEADSARAVRLYEEYANGIHTLIAPGLLPVHHAIGGFTLTRRRRAG